MEREIQTSPPSRHWRFSVTNYDELLPPGPLAEQMDPAVALAAMRHCMTLRKSEGHFHSAWRHIEFAMNQSLNYLDDDIRKKYLDDAIWLLAGIIDPRSRSENENKINPNLYAQVLTLNTFLPVLTKRALNHEIRPSDCANIYASFGHIFEDINSMRHPDASYKSSRFAEMIGPALSSRTLQPDMLLYPASPREEASTTQPLNHDGYFIKGGEKIPLQTKLIQTEKVYDDPTRTIYIEPLALHALVRSGFVNKEESFQIGECTEIIAELITDEVRGRLDKAGKSTLDFLTRSIVARCEYEYCAT